MAMSKKDYELLADALNRAQPARPPTTPDPVVNLKANARYRLHMSQHRVVVSKITGALAGDNPRFDPDRFLVRCYQER